MNEFRAKRVTPKLFGEKNPKSKLTEIKVKEIREKLRSGRSIRSIGREFGVVYSTIYDIKAGKSWSHVQ